MTEFTPQVAHDDRCVGAQIAEIETYLDLTDFTPLASGSGLFVASAGRHDVRLENTGRQYNYKTG